MGTDSSIIAHEFRALASSIARPAAFVIAASNSSATGKSQADYVCDGTADDIEIQAALNALPTTGGEIHLLDGSYSLTATVSRAIDGVTISGCGYNTVLNYNSLNQIFSVGSQKYWTFKNFRTDLGGLQLESGSKWSLYNIWRETGYYTPTYIDCLTDDSKGRSDTDNLQGVISQHKLIQLLDDMETDGVWTVSGATLTYDTSIKTGGTRSAKLVSSSNNIYFSETSILPDMKDCSFSIMFQVTDCTKINSVEIAVRTTDSTWNHYFKYEAAILSLSNSWQKITFPYLEIGAGTPDLSQANAVRIRVRQLTSDVITVYLDDLRYWKRTQTPKGAITFSFDDGLANTFTNAKPCLDKYKYQAVWGLIVGRLDAATIQNARDAQRQGWDIVSHTVNHDTGASAYAKLQVEPALQYLVSKKWLAENGFKSGSRFAILEQGFVNDAIYSFAEINNIITRPTLGYYNSLPGIGSIIRTQGLKSTTTLSTVKSWVDIAVSQKVWLNLVIHNIDVTTPTIDDWLLSDFSQLVDYCYSVGIEVLTYSDVVDRIKNTAKSATLNGSATVTAGQTSVVISHYLPGTPTNISLTPTTDTGGKRFWISAKTATTFTISIDSTSASSISFDWKATI